MVKRLFIATLVAIGPLLALAQNVITGRVIDAKTGEPLIGASVIVKTDRQGVATDVDGNFSLTTKKEFPLTLHLNFIGYRSLDVDVYDNADPIEIRLQENYRFTDEVVVIGYGSKKRGDLTGAISSINTDELQQTPIISVDQGLAGRAAGVQVTQTSGMPGAVASIKIRGASSLQGGNEPLYVIDGFPIYSGGGFGTTGGNTQLSGLSTLNPADIESIQILKDAATTAIYGARAANGVVLITTKSGKAGRDEISFETSIGWSKVSKKIDVMDAQQYAILVNEAYTNDGLPPFYSETELSEIAKLGKGTDWQDELFRTGINQSYQVNLNGGDEKMQYAVSGNYTDQKGVIINSDLKRYSALVNLTRKVKKNFEVGIHANGSYMINNIVPTDKGGGEGVVKAALVMNPILPIYENEESGTYTQLNVPGIQVPNPIATANELKINNKTFRIIANAYAKWDILPELTLKVSGGTDIFHNKSNQYTPSTIYESNGTATATIGNSKTANWLNENTLTWHKLFAKKHDVTLLGGFTLQQNNVENVTASSSNYVSDILLYNSLQSGSVYNKPTSSATQWNILSYLGRADYAYDHKYMVSATLRVDGSSRFGENKKYGFFPSLSGAWTLTEEKWLKPAKDVVSHLRLRAGYGFTGNTEIGVYQSLATLGTYNYIIGGSQVTGFAPNIIPNPDLKWERTGQFDVGLESGFFNDRLRFTVDYYYKKTTDMLYSVAIPYTSGFSTMLQNIGSLENRGWEFSIESENIQTKNFSWRTSFNISFNKNKVLELGGEQYKELPESDGGLKTGSTRRLIVGEPIGIFYGYKFDGIFQNEQETAQQSTSISPIGIGLPRYKDLNGDGKVDATNDRTILGDSNPDFYGGLTNTFQYKRFELNLFFQYSYGNEIFNMTAMDLASPTGGQNLYEDYVNRWTPSNPSNTLQRATTNRALLFSDQFVENGSYLKLKTLSLSYDLPLKGYVVKNLRFYFTATNLFTLTNYRGYDPEVSYRGASTLEAGEDFGSYPQSRNYTFGIKLNF